MVRSTEVLLGAHFEKFIATEIEAGNHRSASDVVRAALKLYEEEMVRARRLNDALALGEESGFVDDFDPEAHLQSFLNRGK